MPWVFDKKSMRGLKLPAASCRESSTVRNCTIYRFALYPRSKLRGMRSLKQFTLIELIVLLFIMGILAVMFIPLVTGTTEEAKLNTLSTDLAIMRRAIASDHGHKWWLL